MSTDPASFQGADLKPKQSAATFALTIFIGSALYLHWRYGGAAALFSLKALGFFTAGIFLAPLILGAAFFGLNRFLTNGLARFAPDRASARAVSIHNAFGTVLLALEVVIGYLFTRTVFVWVYF